MSETASIVALRRFAIAAQGFANRYLRAGPEEIVECVRRLSCVQLDSISTVERSHLLVLGSRVGEIQPGAVSKLLERGRLFEYWAHEACLLDIADYPLWRARMNERHHHHWWGPVIASNRKLAKQIVDSIRERGPLASRHFEGRGGGGMWNLKPAKKMLDALWTAGQLAVCGRQGFQRVYDLPERVIPLEILEAPLPGEKATWKALTLKAVRARGVLTAHGVVNHYKLAGGMGFVREPLEELVGDGALKMLSVEDGEAPVYIDGALELGEAKAAPAAVLLSPFENLLWDRAFTKRLFGFNHLIEVYKPEPQREFGYYVLPFLLGDRLVGRADLKADREASVLRVKKLHLEPEVKRSSALEEAFQRALSRLARTLRLDSASFA